MLSIKFADNHDLQEARLSLEKDSQEKIGIGCPFNEIQELLDTSLLLTEKSPEPTCPDDTLPRSRES